MNTAKKPKPQTPKPTGTPKSILKTPKPTPSTSQPTPRTEPKASLATPKTLPTTSFPKTPPNTPTTPVLKSILKKPKPLTDTPAKISAQPAKMATLKQSTNKPTKILTPAVAPNAQKKASPKSNLKGVSSPYPVAAAKKGKNSPFPQSNGAKKTQSIQKLPKLDEQENDSEDDDDDDDDVGVFDLGSDEDEDDDEGGFDVASQIARALSTKPKATKKEKASASKLPAKKTQQALPSSKQGASRASFPQLSESDDDDDDDDVDMNAVLGESSDDDEDAIPSSQLKNWKALASKTLTGKEPVTQSKTPASGLGLGLPSVPRSAQKKGEAKSTQKTEATKQPKAAQKQSKEEIKGANVPKQAKVSEKKVGGKPEQKNAEQDRGVKRGATNKAPETKVQMFDDSEDETALDFDGGEGDEGDEDEQEASILRALHKKGDFSDLVGSKGPRFADEDEGDEGDEGDEEGGDSSEDFENEDLPIEKAAKRLAAMEKRVEKEAQAELQTNMQEIQTFQLPSGQEIEQEKLVAPDLTLLNQRIQDVLFTLADFRKKKEPERSRIEYMERLAQDLTTYYGYLPELIDRFLEMFSPAEAVEFLMANEAQRPVTLRINSLKTRRGDLIQSLSKRGIHVEPLADWTKVGCKVTMSKLPLGATPEYMAGHYVLQSAASFLPVMALAPQEHERVLDMCASPGGKATYIAALMKNTGMLVANDASPKRLASLTGNIHRLGVRNAVVTNFDGRKLKKHFGLFDRILLDAPCSGLGVISKDPSVKTTKTNKDIQRSSHIQKELVLAAIDMLDADSKTGGYLVYSTCSISVEENEEVVDYLLSHRHVKIVETNIPFGVVGMTRYRTKQFHPSVALARRFYPHVHNMDGFFVCKFKKLSDGPKAGAALSEDPDAPESGLSDLPSLPEEGQRKKHKKTATPSLAPPAVASLPTNDNGTFKPKKNQVSAAPTAAPVKAPQVSAAPAPVKAPQVSAAPAPVKVSAAPAPVKAPQVSVSSGGVKRKTDKPSLASAPVSPQVGVSPKGGAKRKKDKGKVAPSPVEGQPKKQKVVESKAPNPQAVSVSSSPKPKTLGAARGPEKAQKPKAANGTGQPVKQQASVSPSPKVASVSPSSKAKPSKKKVKNVAKG
jgi:ribosomal RNA methyltransferase Nop2